MCVAIIILSCRVLNSAVNVKKTLLDCIPLSVKIIVNILKEMLDTSDGFTQFLDITDVNCIIDVISLK